MSFIYAILNTRLLVENFSSIFSLTNICDEQEKIYLLAFFPYKVMKKEKDFQSRA